MTRLQTRYRTIDIFHPDPADIDIDDVAHHLAKRARWNGATANHYSVADHAITCARYAQHLRPDRPRLALWALLHDAAEAYIPDVPRCIRHGLGWMIADKWQSIQDVEKNLLKAVQRQFGLPWPIPVEIWAIDDGILATEAQILLPGRHPESVDAEPIEWPLHPAYNWRQSRDDFLDTFYDLTNR